MRRFFLARFGRIRCSDCGGDNRARNDALYLQRGTDSFCCLRLMTMPFLRRVCPCITKTRLTAFSSPKVCTRRCPSSAQMRFSTLTASPASGNPNAARSFPHHAPAGRFPDPPTASRPAEPKPSRQLTRKSVCPAYDMADAFPVLMLSGQNLFCLAAQEDATSQQ